MVGRIYKLEEVKGKPRSNNKPNYSEFSWIDAVRATARYTELTVKTFPSSIKFEATISPKTLEEMMRDLAVEKPKDLSGETLVTHFYRTEPKKEQVVGISKHVPRYFKD